MMSTTTMRDGRPAEASVLSFRRMTGTKGRIKVGERDGQENQ
jgi:hypothetical protein